MKALHGPPGTLTEIPKRQIVGICTFPVRELSLSGGRGRQASERGGLLRIVCVCVGGGAGVCVGGWVGR